MNKYAISFVLHRIKMDVIVHDIRIVIAKSLTEAKGATYEFIKEHHEYKHLPLISMAGVQVEEGYKIDFSWDTNDILQSEHGKGLTKEDAKKILQKIKHNYDATIGVNWNVVESATVAYKQK